MRRRAQLHELAADWTPALAAILVRTKHIAGELIAEAVAGLDDPIAIFVARSARRGRSLGGRRT